MEVNNALVIRLSELARLDFDPESLEEIKKDLSQMIAFVDKLKELDTEGIEPLIHMSGNVNMLRPDHVQGSVSRDEALKNAPSHDRVFFKVPRVIKT
ncbi:MAG TPA: Asp-tRNA(Asn)/Glu-tRNA(Gln) amidotransferase subunit GatC [Chitinophagaceae bacterium]|nr:Asp-tRNA(Asn)/Glu-tRNA(Gln) amidotransferase subunit GatC [Chitinophagaceae bacterium]